MSIPRQVTITCPYCGKNYSVKIFESISTDYAKNLPQRIIDGTWFDSVCPNCHKTMALNYDMLYHDMNHHAVIWLINRKNNPDYQKKIEEIRSTTPTGYISRLVHSKDELREKVACLEKNRDDRIIELYKAFLLSNLLETKHDFAVSSVHYCIVENREVLFFYDDKGKAMHCFVEDTLYNSLNEQFMTKINNDKTVYPLIDLAWANQAFSSSNRSEPEQQPSTNSLETPIASPESAALQKALQIKEKQEPKVMFCRKCGKKLPDGSDFCQYCGARIMIVKSMVKDKKNPSQIDLNGEERATKKRGGYAQAFLQHYENAIVICEKVLFNSGYKQELLPAMFVVADFAALSAQKDRNAIAGEIMPVIRSYLTANFTSEVFHKRVDLYGAVIRGKALRAEWLFGNSSRLNQEAITRVGGLLGDILFNPSCANDYDNASTVLRDMQNVVAFGQTVMWPIISELTDLFKTIYDLSPTKEGDDNYKELHYQSIDDKLHALQNGNSVFIEGLEILDQLVDLQKAKNDLPEGLYQYVMGYCSGLEELSGKSFANYSEYQNYLLNSIRSLDKGAPYDKYFGPGGETLLPLLNNVRQEYINSGAIIKELSEKYYSIGDRSYLTKMLSSEAGKSLELSEELGSAFCGVLVYGKQCGKDCALYKFDALERYIIANPNNTISSKGQQAVAYFCGLLTANHLASDAECKALSNKYMKMLLEKLFGKEEAAKFFNE